MQTSATVAGLVEKVDAMHSAILGNGSPGRLSKVEAKVDSLQRHKYIVTGVILALFGLAEILYHTSVFWKRP
jgi:hypothetical protein